MRLIAFIAAGVQIRKILDHIGEGCEPPHISPARGPPLWDDCSDAQMDDEVQIEPADWDLAPQEAPDFEVDQRISWGMVEAAILTCRWVGLRGPPQMTLSSGEFW
jgi:hypothetical protein